jgi:hypothetical protein
MKNYKVALITGQYGLYLVDFLLEKDVRSSNIASTHKVTLQESMAKTCNWQMQSVLEGRS